MSSRIIPLEPVDDSGGGDEFASFTEIVVILHLEGLPPHDHGGETFFDSVLLTEVVAAAFALGCAVGVDFPDRIDQILEQTHPDAVEHLMTSCREPLERQVAVARQSPEPLEPDDFIGDLLEALEEQEHADIETAQKALYMSFEYGLILADVQRSAALVLRNAFNRTQEELMREFQVDATDEADAPAGPVPFESLQEFAAEIMSAYEADIGFAKRP